MPICLGEFFSQIMIIARSRMLFKDLSFLSAMMLSSNRIPIINRWHSEINFNTPSLLNYYYSNGCGTLG